MSRISETEETALILRHATDDFVKRPLWEYPPSIRPAVLHERRRRGLDFDPEPIGDAEFS